MKLKNKLSALAVVGALISLSISVAPAARAADPVCSTANFVETCLGKTSDGAAYMMMVPANFNGTAFLYSHGYRYAVDIPAALPLPGAGYKVADLGTVPEPAPSVAVIPQMLAKGYAVFGSGFTKAGWVVDSAVETNKELIEIFKKKFTKTQSVVAWGNSMGGFITQALAEKYPNHVDVAMPMCTAAGELEALVKMAGDALFGLKTFFDPTIKGGNYSAGLAGYAEQMADITKILTIAGHISGTLLAGTWPATAPATTKPLQDAGIPARSALVAVGLIAGLPTQSAHFDGVTGPGPDQSATAAIQFAAALSPALGTVENLAAAALLGVLVMADLEGQVGQGIYDNTKANWADQLGDGKFAFSSALSGFDAADGIVGYLSAVPRVTGNATSIAKLRTLTKHQGKFNVPTIAMTAPNDPVTPGGHTQWLADKAIAQLKAERAAAVAELRKTGSFTTPKSKFIAIWNFPPDSYTKFNGTTPITSTPAVNGSNHCNFTAKQILAMAEIGANAAARNGLPSPVVVRSQIRKAGGLSFDPSYEAARMKFYGEPEIEFED